MIIVQNAAEAKADAVLITALDETAWLFNMRGGDVDYNPIFVSYGLVTAKEATLFVDEAKARPHFCFSQAQPLPLERQARRYALCTSSDYHHSI